MDMTRDGLIPAITGSERSYLRVAYCSRADMCSRFGDSLARMERMRRFQDLADTLRALAFELPKGRLTAQARIMITVLDEAAEFLWHRADDRARALRHLRRAKAQRLLLDGVEG